MYSIKPGRGPSWGGVVGGVVVAIFGVCWTMGAASHGAPGFFTLFGVVFVLLAIGGVVYNFYNATSKNRLSNFDVTGPGEEPDPLDPKAGPGPGPVPPLPGEGKFKFCPYCGTSLQQAYAFCPQCGKGL